MAVIVDPSAGVGNAADMAVVVPPVGRYAEFLDRPAPADAAAEDLVEQVARAVETARQTPFGHCIVAASIRLERRHDLRPRAAGAGVDGLRPPALERFEVALHFFDLEVDRAARTGAAAEEAEPAAGAARLALGKLQLFALPGDRGVLFARLRRRMAAGRTRCKLCFELPAGA